MAATKLSDLPPITPPLDPASLAYVVQAGVSEKATVQDFVTAGQAQVPSFVAAQTAQSTADGTDEVLVRKADNTLRKMTFANFAAAIAGDTPNGWRGMVAVSVPAGWARSGYGFEVPDYPGRWWSPMAAGNGYDYVDLYSGERGSVTFLSGTIAVRAGNWSPEIGRNVLANNGIQVADPVSRVVDSFGTANTGANQGNPAFYNAAEDRFFFAGTPISPSSNDIIVESFDSAGGDRTTVNTGLNAGAGVLPVAGVAAPTGRMAWALEGPNYDLVAIDPDGTPAWTIPHAVGLVQDAEHSTVAYDASTDCFVFGRSNQTEWRAVADGSLVATVAFAAQGVHFYPADGWFLLSRQTSAQRGLLLCRIDNRERVYGTDLAGPSWVVGFSPVTGRLVWSVTNSLTLQLAK